MLDKITPKTALIVGASGLIGGHLLQYLLRSNRYSEVKIVVRKQLEIEHPKLQQIILNFDDDSAYDLRLKADEVFCTLGTTIKKAGSEEAFRKVDFSYPLQFAKTAKRLEARCFCIVTALGANEKSGIFYNRVKGEIERELQNLNLNQVIVFRPSLLLGNRAENRAGEKIAIILSKIINPIMIGPLRIYRAIEAQVVAWTMQYMVQKENSPYRTLESAEIQHIYDTHSQS
jgi:uncharacterized protein YbjT (DUF2867 family)